MDPRGLAVDRLDREGRRADTSISGYGKRRRTEEGWRAEKPEWKRQVEADLRAGAA